VSTEAFVEPSTARESAMDDTQRARRSPLYVMPRGRFRPVRRSGRWTGRVFLQGLAAVLPAALTIYLLVWLARTFESILGGGLKALLPENVYRPGFGLLLGVLLIFGIGIALQLLPARHLFSLFDASLQRLPVVRSIYGPLKDMMVFVVSSSKGREGLQQAVRVDFPGDLSFIGFLTKESARDLTCQDDDAARIAVYLPLSYQIGGYMILVPRSAIRPLDLGLEQVLRMTMTAGMSTSPADPKPTMT
jgi:uncharacterized membrane protein